ncbi:uncharacterized protein LOC129769586 [Toxorhynchites rutilus septentrionalis]|uniref:uncharacterized protein LOC129769586 n=1 Tax=Toxorhynchites rutilus septentrionalis TaxID=329112 RepID=UPI00247A44AF|nr:uncharacterized protein LOC129769586 [Toxorhynchites rutilus septentrionalis]
MGVFIAKTLCFIVIVGYFVVYAQDSKKSQAPNNGTTYEEVVVETSLYVKKKPATALRRQRLLSQEKGFSRSKRAISHSINHPESKLKSNALNPVIGQQKDSHDFFQSFFDKGFTNGASKFNQRAFYIQKPVTSKQEGSQPV